MRGRGTYSKVSMMANYVCEGLVEGLKKKRTERVERAQDQASMRLVNGAVEVFEVCSSCGPGCRS